MEVSSTTIIDSKSKVLHLKTSQDFLKFMCPVRMVINGPTLSGKSECILKLVKYREALFDSDFER